MTKRTEPLGQLTPGTRGQVIAIGQETGLDPDEARMVTERLWEIGFTEGADIEVIGESPFGRDPLAVRVDQTLVALRRREAQSVLVEIDSD